MQHKQHTFKFKSAIDNLRIFVNTFIYKRDLTIAAHLLHVYLPIANMLGNNITLSTFANNCVFFSSCILPIFLEVAPMHIAHSQ